MQNTRKCSTIQSEIIQIRVEESLQKNLSYNRIELTRLTWRSLRLYSILLLLLLSLTPQMSYGQNIDHVNVGRIAVDDQSLRSQQNAGKQALAQVFVKLSGNQNVLREPEISKAVDNYEQFLIASSFLQHSETLVFEATFSRTKIESLLLASGLSVWASLRPSGVLWLANETADKQRVMLSQLSAEGLAQKVNLKSFARGVDIVVPLGDLEDSMNVSVYDIWNQHISKLQGQSIRYATNYLISATVQSYTQEQAIAELAETELFYDRNAINKRESNLPSDETNALFAPIVEPSQASEIELPIDLNIMSAQNRPAGQGELLVDTEVPSGTTHKLDYVITYVNPNVSRKVETGRIFGTSEEAVMLKIIDVYANKLAKEFALSAPNERESEVILAVFHGIDSLEDYVNLIALLTSIPSVENVRLLRQSSNNAVLEIQQNMSSMQLKSILSLDERITADSAKRADTEVSFRWLGS